MPFRAPTFSNPPQSSRHDYSDPQIAAPRNENQYLGSAPAGGLPPIESFDQHSGQLAYQHHQQRQPSNVYRNRPDLFESGEERREREVREAAEGAAEEAVRKNRVAPLGGVNTGMRDLVYDAMQKKKREEKEAHKPWKQLKEEAKMR